MAVTLPRDGRYKPKVRRHDWDEVRARLEAEPGEWVKPLDDAMISSGSVSWLRRGGPLALQDIAPEIEYRLRHTVNSHLGSQAEGILYARWTPGEAAPPAYPGKMTNDQVREAREEYAAGGISQADLAAKYGMGLSGMNSVLRGHTRVDAGGPIHDRSKKKEQSA